MRKEEKIIMFIGIYNKYRDSIKICCSDKYEYVSYLEVNEIVIPKTSFYNPSEWDIFALLHEVGHIVTNTTKMKRYYQEYLATQWALDKSKELDFVVPKRYIDIYQKYIYKWRETSIKLKGKNILSKETLVLKY